MIDACTYLKKVNLVFIVKIVEIIKQVYNARSAFKILTINIILYYLKLEFGEFVIVEIYILGNNKEHAIITNKNYKI